MIHILQMNELVLLKKFGCLEIQGIKYVKIVSDSGPKKGKITENKYQIRSTRVQNQSPKHKEIPVKNNA